jgi:hypothetical protein
MQFLVYKVLNSITYFVDSTKVSECGDALMTAGVPRGLCCTTLQIPAEIMEA